MRGFIACTFLIFVTCASAQPSERATLLKMSLAWQDTVRSGEVTILDASQPLFHRDTERTRFFLQFVREGDSLQSFFFSGGGVIRSYDSGIYRSKSPSEGVFANHLSKDEAWQRIRQQVPYLIALPAVGLARLLHDSSAQVSTLHTSIGSSGFLIERTYPPPSNDKGLSDLHEKVYLNDQGQLVSLEYTVNAYGGSIWQAYSISKATYNSTSDQDINDSIRAVFPEMPNRAGSEKTRIIRDTIRANDSQSRFAQGMIAPSFEGVTAKGEKVSSSTLHGYLLLDFWFSGCPPCFRAKPTLENIQRKYGSLGLKVIGLDPVDADSTTFAAACEHDGYLNLRVPKKVAEIFKVMAYPTFYIIDPEGHIADSPLYTEMLESKVAALIDKHAKTMNK